MSRRTGVFAAVWPPLLVVLILLVLWELMVVLFSIPEYLLPTPRAVPLTIPSEEWRPCVAR